MIRHTSRDPDDLLVVSYGGGVNSTAMLIGMQQRGIKPGLILFADTGGEKPSTYKYLKQFARWLREHDMPELVIVQNEGIDKTLEGHCMRTKYLPSLAYGYKKCSHRFKKEPQEKYTNNWQPARDSWKSGRKLVKAIGYDADEVNRAGIKDDDKYHYWYPLIEWEWSRPECVAAIESAGLCTPFKSACFFCPASTKHDVVDLSKRHPDLFDRAVAMEKAAEPNSDVIKGLYRHDSWQNIVKADQEQFRLFPDQPIQMDCMCFDGD